MEAVYSLWATLLVLLVSEVLNLTVLKWNSVLETRKHVAADTACAFSAGFLSFFFLQFSPSCWTLLSLLLYSGPTFWDNCVIWFKWRVVRILEDCTGVRLRLVKSPLPPLSTRNSVTEGHILTHNVGTHVNDRSQTAEIFQSRKVVTTCYVLDNTAVTAHKQSLFQKSRSMQEDSLSYQYFIPKPPLSRCENLLMYTNTFFNFLKGSCHRGNI